MNERVIRQYRRLVTTMLCIACLYSTAWAESPDLSGSKALEADEAPEEITRNSHYVISNESTTISFGRMSKTWGVLVGVGSDQLYLIAGWMKPEVIVPLTSIVSSLIFTASTSDLHEAQNPKDFLKAWHKRIETGQLIEDTLGETCTRCRKIFEQSQKKVAWRLRRTKQTTAMKIPPSFPMTICTTTSLNCIATDASFHLWRLAKIKIRSVSRAAKQANLPIRALYFSNAEQYFRYAEPFRRISTHYSATKRASCSEPSKRKERHHPDDYWYYIQTVDHFRTYLPHNLGSKVYRLFRYGTEIEGLRGSGVSHR